MILLTSLHTLDRTPVTAVEAASIPPPLLSIKPRTQQIERCVLYTLVTTIKVGSASLNAFYLQHRLLRHFSDQHLAGISLLGLCCEDNASHRLSISTYTHLQSVQPFTRRQDHKMPLCLPPIPLPRPPPPTTAPVTVLEERQLSSNADSSLRATPSSSLTDLASSSAIGTSNTSSKRAADLTRASHNDPTEKKSRRKPVPEPKYLLKCRYGCDSQSGPFKKITSLRRHMMVVHHLLPERLRDKVRNCGCCGRLFTTESELKKHVELTRFCEVSPESRAKWDVLPPTSRQQRADTWCYEEDGTPSDDILIPNPNYTVGSESEPRVPRKRSKRKAADEEGFYSAAIPKKACRRETLESERVVVDLCSPPTEPAQLSKPRDAQNVTDRSLDTGSRSMRSPDASLPTALHSSFPLQGIDLHNHTPNTSSQQFQQPPVPPEPTAFFEWTGNKKKPYVPGNLPSLHGTDAQLARSNNLPLLASGWAFSTPPTVDHLPQLPPDQPLVGAVAESLRLAREHYARFDIQQNSLAEMKAAAKTQRHQQQQQQTQQQQQRMSQSLPSQPLVHQPTAKLSPPYYPPVSYLAFQSPQRLPMQQQLLQQQQIRTHHAPQQPPMRPQIPPTNLRTWT
ncbi:hypothetical protein KC336_g4958 [Hortaea werneckii]|nr:hypothetical protein KC336_g4958 [Hortaea werneckii]